MAKPKSSAEMLKLIGNELTLLWVQMDAYQTLFLIEREKRKKLMDETGPGFFAIVQFTLIESLLLRICRLLDPAEQGGNANISWQNFWQLLSKEEAIDESVERRNLRLLVKDLIEDWSPCRCDTQAKAEEKYARLKNLRNKILAHNDFTAKQKIQANELWIDVSEQDYKLIQKLAGRLWSIYRRAHLSLNGADLLEPQHSNLDNRPSMVLKQLCADRYLDHMLEAMPDERQCAHVAELHAFEKKHMGEDCIRTVFDMNQTAAEYGTTGESQ